MPYPYDFYYLTEDEDDDDDENYDKLKNFSTFIKTQTQRNEDLYHYLYDILGWADETDTKYLDGEHINDIYVLLTPKAKNTMKKNYMPVFRDIAGNDFILTEERRGGRKRKSKKSRISRRKSRKSRKTK
jgi:hypothetical protein